MSCTCLVASMLMAPIPAGAEINNAASGTITVSLRIIRDLQPTRDQTRSCVEELRDAVHRLGDFPPGIAREMDCNTGAVRHEVVREEDDYRMTVRAV